ncbi:MAG: hypothetical protein ABI896_06140 [Actinomycetota bacterium]
MLLRLFRRQEGFALIMAVGVLGVLTIAGTTVMVYSTSNTRVSARSKSDEGAFSLSESALNNAMAVLSKPTNNSLDPDVLPWTEATASSSTFENGTAKWWGTLDRAAAVWTVTGLGLYDNPAGPGAAPVRRQLTAKVPITPTLTQPLNNPAWDYMYVTGTGNACDETLNNNVSGNARMFVAGNLCLGQNAGASISSFVIGGNLDVALNASVGASTSMSTRVETYVGGNCRYGVGSWAACSGNQDARHIYSKLSDGTTIGVNHTPPVIAAPTADFANWYENGIPGPSQPCTSTSGTPPTFDIDYPSRNNNAGIVDLTPASSYVCRVGPGAATTLSSAINASQTTVTVASATGFPASSFRLRIDDEMMTVTAGFGTTTWTVTRGVNGSTAVSHIANQSILWDNATTSGELSWNATTKTLTAKGTIYIDGSAKVANGALNTYNGQAAIYLSGTFYLDGKLCGGVSGSNCEFANWNPNTEMLMIVANGTGGQVNPADSIQVQNNGQFEGGLFGTGKVEFGNNSFSDGPVMGSEIILSNNVTTNAFPTITTVPVGMPSNPAVYAQPNPPQMFSG